MVNGALRAGWVAVLTAALLASPVSAQGRRTATDAERARADALAAAAAARAQARAAQNDIAQLDQRLQDARARRQAALAAALDTQARLLALELDAEIARGDLARESDAVEDMVIAAIFAERAGRTPWGRRGHARVEALARAMGPGLVAQARTRTADLDANERLRIAIADQRRTLGDAQAEIASETTEIETLLAQREAARAAQLAAAAQADRDARRFAAEARSLRDLAARVQPDRSRPATGSLGALRVPVQGRLVLAYGQRNAAGHASDGLTYRTEPGAEVVAPANATVGYAGLFRSYGEILILTLDNGYVIVLAGMESLRVSAGDIVRTGQPVGRMPQAATPAPELYVEVRRNGSPVDPSRRFASREPDAAGRAGR